MSWNIMSEQQGKVKKSVLLEGIEWESIVECLCVEYETHRDIVYNSQVNSGSFSEEDVEFSLLQIAELCNTILNIQVQVGFEWVKQDDEMWYKLDEQ